MYYCKIFVIYLYISVSVIYKARCTRTHGNGTGTSKDASAHSGNLTTGTSSTDQGSQVTSGEGQSAVPKKNYPETALDLSDLKLENEDRGIFKEFALDDWKIKTYRSFVGKNFNTLKLGDKVLWPKERSNEAIYEFLIFNKDKKYLISLTLLRSEAYLSSQYIHCEISDTDASKTKIEMLTQEDFMKLFQQVLDTKLVPPFPKGLPKDPFYQKYRLYKAKSSDPSAGADLEIV